MASVMQAERHLCWVSPARLTISGFAKASSCRSQALGRCSSLAVACWLGRDVNSGEIKSPVYRISLRGLIGSFIPVRAGWLSGFNKHGREQQFVRRLRRHGPARTFLSCSAAVKRVRQSVGNRPPPCSEFFPDGGFRLLASVKTRITFSRNEICVDTSP